MFKKCLCFILTIGLLGSVMAGCTQATGEDPAATSSKAASSIVEVSEAEPEDESVVDDSSTLAVSEIAEESVVSEVTEISDVVTESVVSDSSVSIVPEDCIAIGNKETGLEVYIDPRELKGGFEIFGEGIYSSIIYLYLDEDQLCNIACQRMVSTNKKPDEFVEALINGYGASYAMGEVESIEVGERTWWTQSMQMKYGIQKEKDLITFFVTDVDDQRIVLTAKERVEKSEDELSEDMKKLAEQCMKTANIIG